MTCVYLVLGAVIIRVASGALLSCRLVFNLRFYISVSGRIKKRKKKRTLHSVWLRRLYEKIVRSKIK